MLLGILEMQLARSLLLFRDQSIDIPVKNVLDVDMRIYISRI